MFGIDARKNKIILARARIFAPLILVLILTISSFFYFFAPKIEEMGEMKRSIDKNEKTLSALTKKLSALDGLSEARLEDQLELAVNALPEGKRPTLVMRSLSLLADEAGVQIKSVAVNPGGVATESAEKDKKKQEELFLNYSLKFSGSLDQIKDFVNRLSGILPLTRLQAISFKKSAVDHFEISISVSSYFSFLPKTPTGMNVSVRKLTPEENRAYQQLESEFSLPSSGQITFPSITSGRENPFL